MDKWIDLTKNGEFVGKDPVTDPAAGTNPSARAAQVDPYEDWEKATRPKYDKSAEACWQPVYVRIVGADKKAIQGSAQGLSDLAIPDSPELRLANDARMKLESISKGNTSEENRSFFIFRPEDKAYDILKANNTALIEIEAVGPAVPDDRVNNQRDDISQIEISEDSVPVVTAVIDDQIGFLNERFRSCAKKTRIARLWIQAMPKVTKDRRWIGKAFDHNMIDSLLGRNWSEDSAYRDFYTDGVPHIPTNIRHFGARSAADLADPSFIRPFGFRAGHGTHVMDLAAGFPCEDGITNRPIFAVQIPKLAVAETWGARLDLFVLLGVTQILDWADTTFKSPAKFEIPASVVINISYGVLAGAKDGTGFLEREVARLVKLRNDKYNGSPKTVVVWPSGNGFRSQTRARMEIPARESSQTVLRIQPDDLSVTFLEIWLERANKLLLKLTPPHGPSTDIDLGHAPQVKDWNRGGTTIARVYVQDDTRSTRRRVLIAFCPTENFDQPEKRVPSGAYHLLFENDGKTSASVDIDVQRDDTPSTFPSYGRQAYLDGKEVDTIDPSLLDRVMPRPSGPITRSGTTSAFATSQAPDMVTVGGAFDRHAFDEEAALYSASGHGLHSGGPTLAAVSEETRTHPGRLAAGLFSGSTVAFSGTSMAAPLVTRGIVGQLLKNGTYDPAALVPNPLPSKDERLGLGIAAYTELPGRLPRRHRP